MKLAPVLVVLVVSCGGASPATPPAPPAAPATDGVAGAPNAEGGTNDMLAVRANEEGVAAMNANDPALASVKFREAVARVPELKYFFNLCTSLFLDGKLAEANVACNAVEMNDPPVSLAEKTHALQARIRDEARRQGISLDDDTGAPPSPTDPAPAGTPPAGSQASIAAKLNQAGVDAMMAGKYAEASAKFRDAVARVPEPKYFFNLCTSLFQEGKFSEALTACRAVSPNHPPPALQGKTDKLIQRIQAEAKAQGITL